MLSPNAHFLLAVTNFFKISHLYFLSSNLTFLPLFFFWGFFQSFFSFFGLCFPAKDFPFHIALSSFLSHPAAPVALPYWTSLYSQPFVISPQQQVYYPAVPNPNPNYKAGCLTAPSSGAGPVQAEQPRQAVPVAAHRCGSGSQIDLPKCRTGMATPGSGLWCLRRGSSWSCRVLLILLSCRAERVKTRLTRPPTHWAGATGARLQLQWQLSPMNEVTVPMSGPCPKPKYFSEVNN